MKYLIPLLLFLVFSCSNTDESGERNLVDEAAKAKIAYPLSIDPDTLIELLNSVSIDTNRVNILTALAWNLKLENIDSAILVEKQALDLSDNLKWEKGKAKSNGHLGVYYYFKSNYIVALEYYQKALNIDEKLGNMEGISIHLSNLGLVYKDQHDYEKALDYYFQGLKIAKEIGDQQGISLTLGNIGNVYYLKGDFDKALETYFEGIDLASETKNENTKGLMLGNIGVAYKGQRNYPEAIKYYFQALAIANKLGNKKSMITNLANIGALYEIKNEYKLSFDYSYRALVIADSLKENFKLKTIYTILSTLYQNSTVLLPDSLDGKILNVEGMRLRSLHYFKRQVSIGDSIFSEENKKQLVRQEMNYEFEKREAIEKAQNDKKEALSKEQLKQKETERNYFIGGFILVLILAGFIFRGYRQKQKTNEVISQQKVLVEEKQKEILDSIRYAKKIQKSLFPTEKYIERNINRLKKED